MFVWAYYSNDNLQCNTAIDDCISTKPPSSRSNIQGLLRYCSPLFPEPMKQQGTGELGSSQLDGHIVSQTTSRQRERVLWTVKDALAVSFPCMFVQQLNISQCPLGLLPNFPP